MLSFFNVKKKSLPKDLGNKKIVCIGGGTGLFSLLSGLKQYATSSKNIAAIVTTLDSGGSSGKLITQYGVLPPGDFRNCMVALSEETEVIHKLFQYRFDKSLDEHNFGNLFVTALTEITGSFEQAVKITSRILRIKGEVVPVSLKKNTLLAEISSGKVLEGESVIDTTKNKKIKHMSLKEKPKTNPRAIKLLESADIIIFGPGDLYTSIIPNLLFPNIRKAIKNNTRAKKVLITPVMSKPGETDDFVVSSFKTEIEKYLKQSLTHIIANSHIPATKALLEYQKELKFPIPVDYENLKDVILIKGNFIDENKLIRHSPNKLAKAILTLL
jgi:uncharacterized cofD-like protein